MIDSSPATPTLALLRAAVARPYAARRGLTRSFATRAPTRRALRPTAIRGLRSVVRGAGYWYTRPIRRGHPCGLLLYAANTAWSLALQCEPTAARPSATRRGLRPIVTYIPRGAV